MERANAESTPEPEKHKPVSWIAGLWLIVLSLFLIAAYALSITPLLVLYDWRFLASFVGWSGFLWWWLGSDSIPGRRKATKGFRHSWLVLGLSLLIGGGLGYVSGLAPIGYSIFAAFSAASGAKIGWVYGLRGRIRYCTRCGAYRWHVRLGGNVYCNRCGHQWARPVEGPQTTRLRDKPWKQKDS